MKSNTQFKSKESSSEELVSAIREIPIRLIYDGCCSLENEKEGNFNYEEYLESVKNSSNYGHFLTLSCEDHFIRKFGNQFNCDDGHIFDNSFSAVVASRGGKPIDSLAVQFPVFSKNPTETCENFLNNHHKFYQTTDFKRKKNDYFSKNYYNLADNFASSTTESLISDTTDYIKERIEKTRLASIKSQYSNSQPSLQSLMPDHSSLSLEQQNYLAALHYKKLIADPMMSLLQSKPPQHTLYQPVISISQLYDLIEYKKMENCQQILDSKRYKY